MSNRGATLVEADFIQSRKRLVIIEKMWFFMEFIIEKVCLSLVFIIEKMYLYIRNI